MDIGYQPMSQSTSGDGPVNVRTFDIALKLGAPEPSTDRQASVLTGKPFAPEHPANKRITKVPGKETFDIVRYKTAFAAIMNGAEHGRYIAIGKMMEKMIGKSIIDREVQCAYVAGIGLDEDY